MAIKLNIDKALLDLAATGNKSAITSIIKLSEPTIYAYARHLVGASASYPEHLIEDIAQDVRIKIARYVPRFDATKSAYSTYLYAMIKTTFLQIAMSQNKKVARDVEFNSLDSIDEDSADSLPKCDELSHIDSALDNKKLIQALAAKLDGTEFAGKIHYIDDYFMTASEIAEAEQISIDSARRLRYKILKILRS